MTSAIQNDTLEGLPAMGSDIGGFLQNIAPGLGAFIIVIAVITAVAGIVAGIAYVVRTKIRVH